MGIEHEATCQGCEGCSCKEKTGPVRTYQDVIVDSGVGNYINRVMIGTPTTMMVTAAWAAARYGMTIPVNWSTVNMNAHVPGIVPLNYLVADAQNLIVRELLERQFEWLLLIENDTMPPPTALVQFNEYMISEEVPVVSGLYFTKTLPSEPLVFRGRGNGTYRKFKLGDKVWCDGVPTGMLLVHSAILREMWNDSEEYLANGVTPTRRVFSTPAKAAFDPQMGPYTLGGTSDLEWCKRVIDGGYFKRAGWPKYQSMKYPFLVDTEILCKHITPQGEMFPKVGDLVPYVRKEGEKSERA